MIATFNITGSIEINLVEEQIQKLNSIKSETLKKSYLEEILKEKLNWCSITMKHEHDDEIDFDNVEVEKDWNKYSGSICDLDKHDPCGSPLGIYVENIPTTVSEETEQMISEIGNRKKNKKR